MWGLSCSIGLSQCVVGIATDYFCVIMPIADAITAVQERVGIMGQLIGFIRFRELLVWQGDHIGIVIVIGEFLELKMTSFYIVEFKKIRT